MDPFNGMGWSNAGYMGIGKLCQLSQEEIREANQKVNITFKDLKLISDYFVDVSDFILILGRILGSIPPSFEEDYCRLLFVLGKSLSTTHPKEFIQELLSTANTNAAKCAAVPTFAGYCTDTGSERLQVYDCDRDGAEDVTCTKMDANGRLKAAFKPKIQYYYLGD
jgi:hypothetical protein